MHPTGAFFLFWRAVDRGRIPMRAKRSSSDIERVKIGRSEARKSGLEENERDIHSDLLLFVTS
jgi:hypothetical protein